MFKITATRGKGAASDKRTGEARTAAGLVLASTNLVHGLVPPEERTKLLPLHALLEFSHAVMRAARANSGRVFTATIADVVVAIHID